MAQNVNSTGAAGVTPVTSPLPAREKAPARVRGKRHEPAPDAQALDYAELGIAGTDVPKVESLRLEFAELGRRSTSQVFECGRVVVELRELASDQTHFEKLAKEVLKLSRTGAGNYERVHQNLQKHRDRLVRLGLPASGLYAMSTAEPERVEEVTTLLESGQELTVGQIKAIVGRGAETPKPGRR